MLETILGILTFISFAVLGLIAMAVVLFVIGLCFLAFGFSIKNGIYGVLHLHKKKWFLILQLPFLIIYSVFIYHGGIKAIPVVLLLFILVTGVFYAIQHLFLSSKRWFTFLLSNVIELGKFLCPFFIIQFVGIYP